MTEKMRPQAPAWTFAVLVAVLTLLYLPVFVMMLNSVLVKENDLWVWTHRWYAQVFQDVEILNALKRSVIVAFTASTGALILGFAAAIAIAKTSFPFKRILNSMSFLSLVLPELVFALSLLSWFFILKIQLSLLTVILAHITFSVCFVLMTLLARLAGQDETVENAARDLGASEWQVLSKVIVPLMKPALISAFLLSFLLSFDDFLITFFTSGVGSDTLPIRLYVAMRLGLTPKLSALATLMFVFSFLLIWFFSKNRGSRLLEE